MGIYVSKKDFIHGVDEVLDLKRKSHAFLISGEAKSSADGEKEGI